MKKRSKNPDENFVVYFNENEYLSGYNLLSNKVKVSDNVDDAVNFSYGAAYYIAERIGAQIKEIEQFIN